MYIYIITSNQVHKPNTIQNYKNHNKYIPKPTNKYVKFNCCNLICVPTKLTLKINNRYIPNCLVHKFEIQN